MTDNKQFSRRQLLAQLGVGITAATAGCSGSSDSQDPSEDGGTTPEPTPTPTRTPTPAETSTPEPTPTPASEYPLPDDIDQQEQYNQLLSQVDQAETVTVDDFLSTIAVNQYRASSEGKQVLHLLYNQDETTRLALVETIVEYGDSNQKSEETAVIDAPQLRTLLGVQSGNNEYIDTVIDSGIEIGENGNLTAAEIEFYEVDGFYSDGLKQEYVDMVGEMAEREGISQEDAEYLRAVAKNASEQINGFTSRVQQAKNDNLWIPDSDTDQLNKDVIDGIRDTDEDGLINAVDPSPEQVSSSNDKYSDPIVQNVLKGNPENDYVLTLIDIASDVEDTEEVYSAVRTVGEELAEKGVNLIAIEGNTNQTPIESYGELRDMARYGGSRRSAFQDLGAHYHLFTEDVNDKFVGFNTIQGINGTSFGYTDFDANTWEYTYTFGHEIGAQIGARDVPWLNEENPNSDEGSRSFLSYDDSSPGEFVDRDIEEMKESNFHLNTEHDTLNEYLSQGEHLGQNHDLIFESNTNLETIN